MSFLELILIIFGLLLSLSIHESAHAVVANASGDPTAKNEGRISLNPFAHWDPIGTTLLVGLLILSAVGLSPAVFGWGKPVPVHERNLNNPRIDHIKVALAGPLSNLISAVIFGLAYRFIVLPELVSAGLVFLVSINVVLAIFNLIPIPPLDGSTLISLILPPETYYKLLGNYQIFIFGIIALVWLFPSVISTPVDFITKIILGA